jgi:hypothetical protein
MWKELADTSKNVKPNCTLLSKAPPHMVVPKLSKKWRLFWKKETFFLNA